MVPLEKKGGRGHESPKSVREYIKKRGTLYLIRTENIYSSRR